MHFKHIFRLIGVMLMFFSLSMLPPIAINYAMHEMHQLSFLKSFLITFGSGMSLWFFCRKEKKEIQIHDGFLMVVLFWALLCLFATLPFIIILNHKVSYLDAFFECVSGLTTTGVTIFTYPEQLPKSLLYYRQQLQFLGGMSIIVLTVAIMPILGIGGTRLYRTETPGALKDTKFTPRITQTAKALWSVYLLLTVLCFIFFIFAGAHWLDALFESFATISTGGLMPHHNGFAYYQNPLIEWGAPIFMLLGSINFGSHYLALKKRTLNQYWSEEEFRFYIYIILFALCLGGMIYFNQVKHFDLTHARYVYFSVVSLISSTGSICSDYSSWPLGVIFLFIILSLIGGCHGSTTGGLKVIRVLILSKFYQREVKVLMHPQLITHIKYNNKALDNNILFSLFSYIMTFIVLFMILVFLLILANNDFFSSIAIVTGTLSNSGVALGSTALSYEKINDTSKILSIIAMLAGRLEIFSLFIVFSSAYWRD